jgi:hypothetical protein
MNNCSTCRHFCYAKSLDIERGVLVTDGESGMCHLCIENPEMTEASCGCAAYRPRGKAAIDYTPVNDVGDLDDLPY